MKSRSVANGVEEQIVELPNGLKFKKLKAVSQFSNTLDPSTVARQKAQALPDGFVLFEDFEQWDGTDVSWLPEGWSVDHKNSPVSNRGWKMTQPLSIYDYISSKCSTYELFQSDGTDNEEPEVDEWLISPAFEVSSGMELSWSSMPTVYFYDWDFSKHSTEPITKEDIVNDLKVNISTDGGKTWETIFSHAMDLIESTKGSFFMMFDYSVRPFKVSLSNYAGKTVIIAFQIEGKMMNTNFIDDVTVGLPLTKTNYTRPLTNLFFGLSNMGAYVPASIMAGPVFQPIKYTNKTTPANADFLWTYEDSEGNDKTSTDKNLEVTYTTDYTDDFSTRNNLYRFPVLKASSPTTAAVEFTYPGFFQAGGKGEYERYYTDTQDSEIIDLGLTIADPYTEGTATYADIALPYFGYNNESDRFWSNYTFQEFADENNWNHLEKIADFFYTPTTPLVIEGVRINAYGKVSKNTKFTADIYLLNGAMVIPNTPNYTAVCTGDDISMVDYGSFNDFLSLNFKFEEPIVLSKATAPYFVVAIGGFRDAENVEYFSPEMSAYSNPNDLGLGWTGHQLCMDGALAPSLSWSPVANYTNDELVSFYIMLDAYFPWLEGNNESLFLENAGDAGAVAFDSFHPGENLTFEGLPEWLTAKATGRYGETLVTFTSDVTAPSGGEATVTVKGHGVSKDIKVSVGLSAVREIGVDDSSAPATYYTLDGRRVDNGNLAPGLYIRRTPVSATKVLVSPK